MISSNMESVYNEMTWKMEAKKFYIEIYNYAKL